MKKELEAKVRKHYAKKRAFQVVAFIFCFIGLLLFLISTQTSPSEMYWINFPTFILMGVLGIIYISMFGFSSTAISDPYEEDEDIDREVARLYRAKTEGLEERLDLRDRDRLELIELEELKEKYES